MLLNLYAARKAWLVVPHCLIASRGANSEYGPLFFQGAFDSGKLTLDEIESVMVAFDRDSFARITAVLAARLRGARPIGNTLAVGKHSRAAHPASPP